VTNRSQSTGPRAESRAAAVGPRLVRRHGDTARLVGESVGIDALRGAIRAVAASRSTVLVTGETGTGKGLVARLIHELSGEATFVHVDFASLSPTVIESELFGHERGAFTGAAERRVGRFERAGTGTVFLDEVADVAPSLQAKLLRVLQDRTFERVGGDETLRLRARVVAATNRDLAREIEAGRFRADLYYRLQVVELRVPPLRQRRSDVALLFRAAVADLHEARGKSVPAISQAFFDRLVSHAWPGNVRELRNVAERFSVAKPEGPWRVADLDDLLAAVAPNHAAAGSRSDFEAYERRELEDVLSAHRWNVSAAARSLGVSRGSLRGRMARLGLG
jgi:DNA-binding NtrC family response regulator